jgi:hypothetical protein
MRSAYDVSTLMVDIVKLDVAKNQGEKKLKDTQGFQAIVSCLMYAALATGPNISFAVTALCQYYF